MVRVFEHRSIDELDPYCLPWRQLLGQTRGASFFQSLEWLQVYWRHFGAGQQLRVLVVEDPNEVLGILPLVVRPERTRAGRVRVLTYPLHDWGSFYGPIGPDSTATLAACLRHLHDRRRDWDLLDLRWVNASEYDHGRTPAAMAAAGYPCVERIWRSTAIVDFTDSWESYLARRSSKFRNNLRRAESAAARSGELTFQRYRPAGAAQGDGEPRWDYFDECQQLASRSWQGSSRTGTTLSHAEVRLYFRDLFGVAARAGALDVNLLRHRGELLAFSFNLVIDGRLAGLRIGFDGEQAHLSPGRLLLSRSIADSFHRGDLLIDLGCESMPFKQSWLTRIVPCLRYTHYPRLSLRAQVIRAKHWLCEAAGANGPAKGMWVRGSAELNSRAEGSGLPWGGAGGG
jgi:CelD/BcsL family acetyltransferase involved in cellulose biosynthesis